MKHLFSIFLLAGLTQQALGQLIDPQNMVIENLYIAEAKAEAAMVSILVRDNKLELVSRDRIPAPVGFVTLDANGGYLVGSLVLGEPPEFVILDGDPRFDTEVLMDTKARAVFMVSKGVLRKNVLEIDSDNFEDTQTHPAWRSYSPPPVALPTSYDSSQSWNHWSTRNTTNVFFAVLALDRQFWMSQNQDSEQQVGDLDSYSGGEIRDLRLGIFGALNYFDKPWGYNVVVATNAFDKLFEAEGQHNFRALDYRLDIPIGERMQVSVGKQKEPISMERIMTLINLPMQERSASADAFLPSRNFGVQISGSTLGRRVSWAGGIFNDFIGQGESLSDGSTTATGRVTWVPFVSPDLSNLVHLGFGTRFTDTAEGFNYRSEPEFNKSPLFVNTGVHDSDKTRQFVLEASWRRGPFWLAAEHVSTKVTSQSLGDLDFSGGYVTASWILTGEMRNYEYKNGTFGPVPIARPAHQNGPGALELAIRLSTIDLNDATVSGGNMDILSFAVNWWLSPIFEASLNYRYIMNDWDGLSGETSGLSLRVLLKLN